MSFLTPFAVRRMERLVSASVRVRPPWLTIVRRLPPLKPPTANSGKVPIIRHPNANIVA